MTRIARLFARTDPMTGLASAAGLLAVGGLAYANHPNVAYPLFAVGGVAAAYTAVGLFVLSRLSASLKAAPETHGDTGTYARLKVSNTGPVAALKLGAECLIIFGAPTRNESAYSSRWRGNRTALIDLAPNDGHAILDIAELVDRPTKSFRFYHAQQDFAGGGSGESFERKQIEDAGFVLRVTLNAIAGMPDPLVRYYQLKVNDADDAGFFTHPAPATLPTAQAVRKAEDETTVPVICFAEISKTEADSLIGEPEKKK